jgi:hypothetical protein
LSIELSFERDDLEIADAAAADVAALGAGIVEYSYLRFPITFLVDGESVIYTFPGPAEQWIVDEGGAAQRSAAPPETSRQTRRLPVLFFAHSLQESLGEAQNGSVGVTTVPDGGRLEITKSGARALIVTEQGRRIEVSFLELQEALVRFKRDLLELVGREVPILLTDPRTGPWLRST